MASSIPPQALPSTAASDAPDLLPARMVNEFVYCPRLAYLEWVQGEWDDNADTVEGRFVHRRVDDEPAAGVPGPAEVAPDRELTARSVLLSDPAVGAIARIDLLELEGPVATPVDYKRGPVPSVPERSWPPERVQLCVQGLILRAHGYQSHGGVLYFSESRTRVDVPFDDALVEQTRAAIAGLRAMASSARLPPPLVDSPKCVRCSLVGICLPDETNTLRGAAAEPEPRRLVPGRDDSVPLYVQEQGATVGKRGDELVVSFRGVVARSVKLFELSQVTVFGNVQVTTQALHELCDRGVPVVWCSYGGWLYGVAVGEEHKNVDVRIAQHRLADAGGTLPIARMLVEGKIRNQRTLLRRNLPDRDIRLLGQLALLARQARHARDVGTLLGVEGSAAERYFGVFSRLFRGAGAWAGERFREKGRTRRPPLDEVNAVLSFLYAMLVKECTIALRSVGFDVYRGCYHAPRYGRPALALDLCEEFRPLIADSVAVTLFNQGEVGERDFLRRARGVALTSGGRRAVLAAFERRLNQMVTHPQFGYTISYRRIIELQARLLRAVVLGEVPGYRAFTTR